MSIVYTQPSRTVLLDRHLTRAQHPRVQQPYTESSERKLTSKHAYCQLTGRRHAFKTRREARAAGAPLTSVSTKGEGGSDVGRRYYAIIGRLTI